MEDGSVYDLIVVGSGLCGLQCAAASGHFKVLVLEAEPTIGGRIQETQTFIPGETIALGTEYLYGTNNALFKYAKDHGCSFKTIDLWSQYSVADSLRSETRGERLFYFSSSKRLLDVGDDNEQLGRLNDAFCNIIYLEDDELTNNPGDLHEYLTRTVEDEEMIALAKAILAAALNRDLEEVSLKEMHDYLKALREGGLGSHILEVHPPLGELVSSMADGLNIITNSQVTKILYGGRLAVDDGQISASRNNLNNGLVSVETADGTVHLCKRVVVTSSVASLQHGDITFEPGFSGKKEKVLSELTIIPQIKIFIKFSRFPWPAHAQGIVLSDCAVPEISFRTVANSRKDGPACYCVGICTVKFASKLQNLSPDELIALLLNQLDDALSQLPSVDSANASLPSARSVFLGGMVSTWNETVPCTRGYAAQYVDEEQAETLSLPLADKVFFAGEATITGRGSRLHDAMTSGRLVANVVAASLSAPQLSNALDRYFSQSVATIVGFGSLIAEASARATFPNLKNFRIIRVLGYRRVFGHSPSVMVERGLAIRGSWHQSCLSAEPVFLNDDNEEASRIKKLDMSVGFLAVCFEVGANDVASAVKGIVGIGGRLWCGEALMKREEEFNFNIVCCQKVLKDGSYDGHSFPGLMCVASTDEEFVSRWGESVFKEKLSKTGLRAIWDWPLESALKPCSVYTNHCYLAAQSLGSPMLDSFLDETYLVDRQTTVRTYLSRNPSVLFHQPPSMHDSRHMTDRVKQTPPRNSSNPSPIEMPFPPRLDLADCADDFSESYEGPPWQSAALKVALILGGAIGVAAIISKLRGARHA